ncbi:ATP-dependent helicase [Paraglaciecola arctica]|uniref:ATP-dependent helicase n=1 Tax=Paraglaciecola arctica TaxID=1128911 RepID=UPI001C069109|nr:ATP-dependent helicase [Paraglaciecola arctica]MBU3003942.1 ATP-dependent helicase [Paraglaciecola arctica]
MLDTMLLNKEQQQAVECADLESTDSISNNNQAPLLIIAGAGTGKTNTLAHKTAQLILNGKSPDRILLMTFARRAASELSSRANRIVEQQLMKKTGKGKAPTYQSIKISWMGTFHSIAARLLREHANAIGLESDFTIMDRNDSADMIDVIRHELDFTSTVKRFPKKKTCLDIYSRCVNSKQPIEEILDAHFPYCRQWDKELTRLFAAYAKAKIEQLCLDYDDLLLYCYHMAQVPEIAKQVREQFDYILVDEYQDTNVLQAGILMGFFPTGKGLTVVGDDAQSIYSFRAADVDNILNFPQQFSPPARVISLKQNYRSHQAILDVSNVLLSEGTEGYKVELFSDRKSGTRPKLVSVEDETKQAEYIVETVLAAREQGIELKKQAVLFRSSYHSDRLELELTRRNIPFVKHGGLKFLEAAHVKDLLSILRWADNPKHKISAFRVLKLLPSVGPKIAEKVINSLTAKHYTFSELLDYPMPQVANELFQALVKVLSAIHTNSIVWSEQVNAVVNIYKELLEINYDDHFVRFGDIEQLAQISQQFPSRQRFLTELTLDPPQSSGDLAGPPLIDDDFLILSTVHSAKGQEWTNVFVLNVADGNFPNEYAAGNKRSLEEERRLLNVAITRAKDELHLMQPLKYWVPEQQRHGDRHVYGAKSRFLTEQVLKLLDSTHFPRIQLNQQEKDSAKLAITDIKKTVLGIWDV